MRECRLNQYIKWFKKGIALKIRLFIKIIINEGANIRWDLISSLNKKG